MINQPPSSTHHTLHNNKHYQVNITLGFICADIQSSNHPNNLSTT
ncbi:hypothetical protein BVRB_9g213590 [Beta vulgaris subsp. vulgaris]|nr:hypothetical protein BVRB_9g213590 [Beta vulgaris subsp. vulgaris]